MSSRSRQATDADLIAADALAAEVLAQDADALTSIRHPDWKRRALGGLEVDRAIATASTMRCVSFRMPTVLVAAIDEAARTENLARTAFIRRTMAAEVSRRFGGTPASYDDMTPMQARPPRRPLST